MSRPAISVVALIPWKDGIVLVRRKTPPFSGYWSLPGGHLEFGERLEAAAEREAKEETNLKVKAKRLVGFRNEILPDKGRTYHFVVFCFECTRKGGRPEVGDEIIDVRVFNHHELRDLRVSPFVRPFVEAQGPVKVQ
jgi:8-oxo-dGTP diphosphatase